ncbi:MAG: NifU family protein [bacterium]
MKKKIEEVLDGIRPTLQADGGNIELVDVDETKGAVKVRLTGACHHCPMAAITLKEGVEKVLKERVPEVKELIAVD